MVVGLLAACGEAGPGAQLDVPGAPRGDTIVVFADSPLAQQLRATAKIELTLGGGVDVPATTATLAWTATDASDVSVDDVRSLAAALGIEGDVVQDAAGAWTAGMSPDTGVGLRAGGSLGDSFGYTSATRWEQLAANPCDPGTPCPDTFGAAADAVARATAGSVLGALGIDRDAVEITTEPRADGTIVSTRRVIDGQATSEIPDVDVLVGADGEVLQASGRMSITDQTRTVDLIDAQEALTRAEGAVSGGVGSPGFPTGPVIPELPAVTTLVPGPPPAAPAQMPSEPTTTPPPAPSGQLPPASSADTVTGFGLGHETIWDVDGRRWAIPTYTVSTARNLLISVYAINADMVQIVDELNDSRDTPETVSAPPSASFVPAPTDARLPPTSPPPMNPPPTNSPPFTTTTSLTGQTTLPVARCRDRPPEAGSVPTAPSGELPEGERVAMDAAISAVVVGMATTDAAMLLEAACWDVRISRAGPTTTITPDIRWDRIALIDVDGIVIGVNVY